MHKTKPGNPSRRLHPLIVLALLDGLSIASQASQFYPFGTRQGDSVVAPADDLYFGPFALSLPFKVFSSPVSTYYVCNNGYITSVAECPYNPNSVPFSGSKRIAAFLSDIDTRGSYGQVMHRVSNASTILTLAKSDVSKAYPNATWASSFTPSRVLIATWNKVKGFGLTNTPRNSFQIVVIWNDRITVACFNFALMSWGTGNNVARTYVNAGDGVTYKLVSLSLTTTGISQLVSTSNVGINGKYCFRIDSNT